MAESCRTVTKASTISEALDLAANSIFKWWEDDTPRMSCDESTEPLNGSVKFSDFSKSDWKS